MSGNNDALTLLVLAGVGAATGGLGFAAMAGAGAAGAGATAAAGTAAVGTAAASTAAATTSAFSLSGAITGASAFLGAGAQYMQAQAASLSSAIGAANEKLNLSTIGAAAAEEEENRQRRLRAALSSQSAAFGASNVSGSVTADLLAAKTVGEINRGTNSASVNSAIDQAVGQTNIDAYGSAARSSQTAGVVNAGSSLLKFAGQTYDKKVT